MIEVRLPSNKPLDKLYDKLYLTPMTWIVFWVQTLFKGGLHFCARCHKLTECYKNEDVSEQWRDKWLCCNCFFCEVEIKPLEDDEHA